MKIPLLGLPLLLTSFLLADCGGSHAGPLHVRQEDNRKTVTLAIGQDLYVDLPEPAAPGEAWYVRMTPDSVVGIAGDPQVNSHSELVGSPGMHQFRFTGLTTGTARLEWRRQGHDSTGTASEASFLLRIAVSR